ncbi:MAG: TIGR03619 family F420-dependent LLM class oxidoreductase [Acidimicrobiia bacterium]
MVRFARRAEELGCASLWTFQRLLHPVGSDLGPGHRSVHDPIPVLALVAGHTERIGLGTATVCAPYTAPALLASSMASLDVLSSGRLTVGLGMGWLPEEHIAAGAAMTQRGERFEEYLGCLRALWTDDPVEFSGDFYRVPRSHVGPTVVQRPHPPILLGGSAEPALRRAGRLAQGWIASSGADPSSLRASVEVVRAGAREAGRDPAALRILARVAGTGSDPSRSSLGSAAEIRRTFADLRAQGVTEVCVDPNLVPSIGGVEADPDEALAEAEAIMEGVVAAISGT